jgi:hypothetical protein
MSSNSSQDQARILAERIARRISQPNIGNAVNSSRATDVAASSTDDAGNVGEELAAVRAGLDDLQHRLAHIESHLTRREDVSPQRTQERAARSVDEPQQARQQSSPFTAPPTSVRSPWLSGMYVPATNAATAHPSQERFGVEEAAVSELVDYFEREKTCNLEPGGKPCDHCAMCSSRGF